MMVTIYDIAKKTGYSPATVSKVLNGYKGTSKKANEAIYRAVEEMNYIPNSSARELIVKKSYIIGIILNEHSDKGLTHFHFSEVIESFKSFVEEKGYDVLFINNKIGDRKVTFYEHCRYRAVDGVLIAAGNDEIIDRQIEGIVNSDIPKVSVEALYNNVTTVLCTNKSGSLDAMAYLYSLGHRKIGFIGVEGFSNAAMVRQSAYTEFMNEKGLPIKDNFVLQAKNYTYEAGVEAAKDLLSLGRENIPTSYFCICDEVAFGLIDVFTDNGLKIPEDFSIIGFDDTKTAKYYNLTTMRQNRLEIGRVAGEKLLELIDNNNVEASNIKINTKLITRDTCRKVK